MQNGFMEPILGLLVFLGVIGAFGIAIAYHAQSVRRGEWGFMYAAVVFAAAWAGTLVALDTLHPLWWCTRSLKLLIDWRNFTPRELEGLTIATTLIGCIAWTLAFVKIHFGKGWLRELSEEEWRARYEEKQR